jgi:hypothetical protein
MFINEGMINISNSVQLHPPLLPSTPFPIRRKKMLLKYISGKIRGKMEWRKGGGD